MEQSFILSILTSIIAGILLCVFSLLLFDIEKFKYRLNKIVPLYTYKTFVRINSHNEVYDLFNKLFISYQHKNGGKLFLMSNTGGYPQYNPYKRILELSTYQNLSIYISVTKASFKEYYQDNSEEAGSLIGKKNIQLNLFEDLSAYKIKLGLNTDLQEGFYYGNQGKKNNKIQLEGIRSNNSIIVETIEYLYMGMIANSIELNQKNYIEVLENGAHNNV